MIHRVLQKPADSMPAKGLKAKRVLVKKQESSSSEFEDDQPAKYGPTFVSPADFIY